MKLTALLFTAIFLMASAYGNFDTKKNGEFITISGKVNDVKANSFRLQTGKENIFVEMDEYDKWAADGFKLKNGDQVVVNGRIDKDFLEQKKIEAGSVYVQNIDTYFYANSADEEDFNYIPTTYSYFRSLPDGASVDIQGKITSIAGREFTVDTGLRKITVDSSKLVFNPFDQKGSLKLSTGDRVRVSGKVQENNWDLKEVSANSLIELPATTI
jgi:uncharacterized protein YdeI (BOF family)